MRIYTEGCTAGLTEVVSAFCGDWVLQVIQADVTFGLCLELGQVRCLCHQPGDKGLDLGGLPSDSWLWGALQGQADSIVLQFSQSLLETAVAPLMWSGLPCSGESLESFVGLDSNSGFQRGPQHGLAARESSSGQLLFWSLAAHSCFE